MGYDHSFPNYKDLAQASQLAQDIEASFQSSSERKFVSKVRKQDRCPPKTTIRPNTIQLRTLRINLLWYHVYGHIAARCPTGSLLIEDDGLDEGNLKEDVYEPRGPLVTHMRMLSYPI